MSSSSMVGRGAFVAFGALLVAAVGAGFAIRESRADEGAVASRSVQRELQSLGIKRVEVPSVLYKAQRGNYADVPVTIDGKGHLCQANVAPWGNTSQNLVHIGDCKPR